MAARLTVNPGGTSTVVALTSNSVSIPVFTDSTLAARVVMPATISAAQDFWVADDGVYGLSLKQAGVEQFAPGVTKLAQGSPQSVVLPLAVSGGGQAEGSAYVALAAVSTSAAGAANLAALNAVNVANAQIILPAGAFPVSGTFVPAAGVTMASFSFPNQQDAVPTDVGTTLFAGPGFAGNSTGYLVDVESDGFGLNGVNLDAGTIAAGALYVNAPDIALLFASLMGGTTETLTVTSAAPRFAYSVGKINNLANAAGGAFSIAGTDSVWVNVRKKSTSTSGGSGIITGGGGLFTGCHLTGGAPNLSVGAPTQFTGCYIDTTNGTSMVSNTTSAGATAPPAAVFTGCKFYNGPGGTGGLPVILNTTSTPNGVVLTGCFVDAVATAQSFSYLISNPGSSDFVSAGTSVSSNAFNSTTPALYPATAGSTGRYFPGTGNPVSINGGLWPGARQFGVLATNTALTAAQNNTLAQTGAGGTSVQPGLYLVWGSAIITSSNTGSVDVGATFSGTCTGHVSAQSQEVSSAGPVSFSITGLITVTVAGDLTLVAYPSAGTTATAKSAPTSGSALAASFNYGCEIHAYKVG